MRPATTHIQVSIKRGDLDQMSFAFFTIEDEWAEEEFEGRKFPVRTLHDLEIDDVSVVTYPAYHATEVQVRSAQRYAPGVFEMALRIAEKIKL
jgi:HK97 family phage prohead protease